MTKLFEQQLVLVTGRKYRRHHFDLDALRDTPIVDYYQSDPLIHRWIAHHYRRKPPTLSVRVWAATTNLVLELVLGQAGVGVLPHHVALPYVKRGRLSVVKTGRPEVTDVLWLKELEGAYRGPGLEAFRSAALDEFASA